LRKQDFDSVCSEVLRLFADQSADGLGVGSPSVCGLVS